MGMWLLLIFSALPIVEIALFIEVGGLIGVLPTLGLVVLAAVAGVAMMRAQGAAGARAGCAPASSAGGDPRRADRARRADPGRRACC